MISALTLPVAVAHPWLLLLLPLAVLPLWRTGQKTLVYSSLDLLPPDHLSSLLAWALRVVAAVAIAAVSVGLSGLYRPAFEVQRIGQGAHMVLLLDRSSSMDRPFAGSSERLPALTTGGTQAKGQVARQLLADFTARRNQDLFGMLVFSTHPIQVLPLTEKQPLIQAAIAAGKIGRGLAKTDLGAGLIKALEFFEGQAYTGSRIVLLVSDGAAKLSAQTQDHIRNLSKRHRAALYWIYIRTRNSPGLEAKLDLATAREIAPEQLLHRFFRNLEMPYRAYSAEHPQALQQAIDDVSRLQNLPILYTDIIPRRDLSGWCYGIAMLLIGVLALAKSVEISTWR